MACTEGIGSKGCFKMIREDANGINHLYYFSRNLRWDHGSGVYSQANMSKMSILTAAFS